MTINTKISNSGNYQKNRTSDIKFIVIHYTANYNDTANNNATYFAREIPKTSAHYFVDENEVWQSVADKDAAWHCGGGRQSNKGGTFYGKCTNNNSLGVELCLLKKDKQGNVSVRTGTINKAVELVKSLMQKYNVPLENVIRHFDVTGKNCPAPMVENEILWANFKKQLESEEEEMRYKYYDDMPEWAKPTISKLVRKGILQGTSDGGVLDLSNDMLRIFVANDRAGMYGD